MKPRERRKLERFNLRLNALVSVRSLKNPARPMELFTKNVCSGGAYFQTATPLPLHTRVDVRMMTSISPAAKDTGKNADIVVSGEVVRRDPQGMAVRFARSFRFFPVSA